VIERIRNEGTDFLLDTLPQTLLSARSRATKPGVVERLRTMIARVPAESIIATHLMLAKRPDSTPTLKTIRVPTLVVVGEEDTVSPPSHAEAMVREIAGARLAMIPGAGHLLPLEVPDAFCRILDSFLEDMGAGRSPRTRVPPLS
jgi:pimeloyl-ACP methyl ester carboxylesterase